MSGKPSVFRWDGVFANDSSAILHSFATNNPNDGVYPTGDIVLTSDGWLCGTTVYGGATRMLQ